MENAYFSLVEKQRQFFATGKTLALDFRIAQLKKIKSLLTIYQSDLIDAVRKDLHRSSSETILAEIFLIKNEIRFILKNLSKWMQATKSDSIFPLNFIGKSQIVYEPFGSVFIISPWNYPLLLLFSPLIGAMSAGNCLILKPSEVAKHTQKCLIEILNKAFLPEYLIVIEGGPSEVNQLLQQKLDYIFFTGSSSVGKIILEAAAKHLTPTSLELGGKNPCIVDETANLNLAAERIIWSKTSNAGQVCLAPDYLYVHRSCKDQLITKMIATLKKFYGEDIKKSASYGRIINQKHFSRIERLLTKGKIIFGGEKEETSLYIAPTLIEEVEWSDPIMQEEIFGPLLPIFPYDNLSEVVSTIKKTR